MKAVWKPTTIGLLIVAVASVAGQANEVTPGVRTTAALEDEVGALEGKARSEWPESFAGVWVDLADDDVLTAVNVAFTNDAQDKAEQLSQGFSEPQLVNPVEHEHSLVELEARQSEMIADREKAKGGSLTVPGLDGEDYDLGLNIPSNALVLVAESPSAETRSWAVSQYGDDLIVKQGSVAQPDDCTRSDCRYGLRSGLQVTYLPGLACSTAFTVKKSDGTRNILSAAHCGDGDVGETRYHGGERYGEVKFQQLGTRVDAERHGPPEGDFVMNPNTYVNDGHKFVSVQEMSDWDTLTIGFRACKSGASTNQSCGVINDKYYSPSYVPNGERFVRVGYCADGGDSGSGVYKDSDWNKVHGIHSGGGPEECPDDDDYGLFGHIEYALNALDVTLVKN